MTEKELIKLYQDCLDFWSIDRQLRMLQEECTELATAISHHLRNRSGGEDHFLEEMADVYLMYNQVLFFIGQDRIDPIITLKAEYIRSELEKSKAKKPKSELVKKQIKSQKKNVNPEVSVFCAKCGAKDGSSHAPGCAYI